LAEEIAPMTTAFTDFAFCMIPMLLLVVWCQYMKGEK